MGGGARTEGARQHLLPEAGGLRPDAGDREAQQQAHRPPRLIFGQEPRGRSEHRDRHHLEKVGSCGGALGLPPSGHRAIEDSDRQPRKCLRRADGRTRGRVGPGGRTAVGALAFLLAISVVGWRIYHRLDVTTPPWSEEAALIDYRDAVYYPVVALSRRRESLRSRARRRSLPDQQYDRSLFSDDVAATSAVGVLAVSGVRGRLRRGLDAADGRAGRGRLAGERPRPRCRDGARARGGARDHPTRPLEPRARASVAAGRVSRRSRRSGSRPRAPGSRGSASRSRRSSRPMVCRSSSSSRSVGSGGRSRSAPSSPACSR